MKAAKYDFSERVAVVTGGASGIGLAIALRLVADGARVSLWDKGGDRLAQATGKFVQKCCIDSQEVDVTDSATVDRAAAAVVQRFGRIDMLVASAGISGPFTPCDEYPIDAWQRQLDVNLTGVFYSCRSVIPAMRRNGYGRIVTIASTAGKEGNPMTAGYSASKAGVIGLTKSMGKELATSGITVNCITPALVHTPMHEATLKRMPADLMASLKAKIPMGRVGTAEEVANMVSWILSEECSFTTGATFDLSGGRTTY